jgi:hypothetical protein
MKAQYGKLTTDCARKNSKRTDFKMLQILFRFVVGGFVVSLFAALGNILKPKSFAGLFGAAPSVALATLGLTIATNGRAYAAIEARSMILGAAAFCLYAEICSRLMRRFTKLTNGFSKKVENLRTAVSLHFAHDNFVRQHNSLRITPALAAGVSDSLRTLEELVKQTSR